MMRTAKITAVVLLLAGVLIATARPAHAIPAFARKYGFQCGMCHAAWPMLNDFGQQYRQNGYQIPGEEAQERTILQLPSMPIAARTMAGYTSDAFSPSAGQTEVSRIEINGLDLLSGGVLARNRSFFVGYLPQIGGGSGVEPQAGDLEQANAVFPNLSSTWLNLRVGRMEGGYLPFSQLRSLTISPYEVYGFDGSPMVASGVRGSRNPFMLADNPVGIELSGYGRSPWHYVVGVANGTTTNQANDGPADVYARGAYVFGRGFGQRSGQRLGVTSYFGRARALTTGTRSSFRRLGADANLNSGPWNLQLLYLAGRDNAAFNAARPGSAYKWSGGFGELNYFTGVSAAFARFDWVDTPSEDGHDITRYTVGYRMSLAPSEYLQLEFSHRGVANGAAPGRRLKENFATARVDFAF